MTLYQKQAKKAMGKNRLAYGYWIGRIQGKTALQAYKDAKTDMANFPNNDLIDWLLTGI